MVMSADLLKKVVLVTEEVEQMMVVKVGETVVMEVEVVVVMVVVLEVVVAAEVEKSRDSGKREIQEDGYVERQSPVTGIHGQ